MPDEAKNIEIRELGERDFKRIARMAERIAGLALSRSKSPMIASRINKRLRALNSFNLSEYLDYVESKEGDDEKLNFINALTTNVTQFFRESHHFDKLRDDILPKLNSRLLNGERVRLWSAGCSSGQEPYSIAMAALDHNPDIGRLDFRILATDIDGAVLERAKTARYEAAHIASLPANMRQKFAISEDRGSEQGTYLLRENVRGLVRFARLNLIESWPMTGTFDVVFCRNVVIYFSEDTQNELWRRFAAALNPGGWLFLGHSERIGNPASAPLLMLDGPTSYRKGISLNDGEQGMIKNVPA